VIGFPLLIIPFAIYNMIAFLTPGFDWGATPYTFPLKSGVQWGPTYADGFLVFSLLLLMFEVIKSTRHGRSLVEHFLVMLLAFGAAAEFVLVKEVGNSVFMLFTAICFVDLFAGFAAALRRARRKVVVEQAPVVAPTVAPAPAPAVVRTEPPVVRTEPAVVRTEPVRVEPAPMPRAEPSPFAPAEEPLVKADPVQKIGS
jgi:hypothetical protein